MNSASEPLPNDVAALHAMLTEAWAERDAERAEKAQLAAQNDRLRHLIRQLQRLRFGRRSEKLDPDQFNLVLEDLEQAIAANEAAQENADSALRKALSDKRRAGRSPLPDYLPRIEIVIAPEDTACPCCGGAMHVIGEDRSQRLDVIPAQYRVLVTRRPKYVRLPRLPGSSGPGAGAGTADRRRPADRAVGSPGRGGEVRRPLPALPTSPDPGATRDHNRSGDLGFLGRLCRGRDQTPMAAAA
jgi:hypothetical protein